GVGGKILEPAELAPPSVREILVEGDDTRPFRPGHDPPTTIAQHRHACVTNKLVVDVVADAERKIDLLRFEAGDLATENIRRVAIVRARHPQALVVALLAAERGARQGQAHDRSLRETRIKLV